MRHVLLLLLSVLPGTAVAAEVTEMAPGLRGDVEIAYSLGMDMFGLEEAGATYGRGQLTRHDVAIDAEFSPADGIVARIGLPVTAAWQLQWADAYKMEFDPVTESGTYVDAEPLDAPPTIKASGLQGVWLGAAIAPFSETYALKQLVTWRLEAAFRPGSSNTLWSTADGRRGVAPGGSAWMLGAAFSTNRGVSSPYLSMNTVLEGAVTMDVVDEAGQTVATAVTLQPASTIDVIGGVEITSTEDEELGRRFAFDLFAGFGYRSWADIPSGIFLPSVLDASRGIVVTQGEHLTGLAGLGVIYDINQYVGLRMAAEGRYATPYRLEHVYAVRRSFDSFGVVATAELEGRIR